MSTGYGLRVPLRNALLPGEGMGAVARENIRLINLWLALTDLALCAVDVVHQEVGLVSFPLASVLYDVLSVRRGGPQRPPQGVKEALQGSHEGPKTAPRQPQEGSKTHLKRILT